MEWRRVIVLAIAAVFGVLSICLYFGARFRMNAFLDKQVRDARVTLASARTDGEKCFPLSQIAKDDVNHGKLAEARDYADQLLAIAQRLSKTEGDKTGSAYGNAVHDGNLVLGRLAMKEHKIDDAKAYLLKAGKTPGSPTLDSFGPNMSLANDLLNAGQRDTVIEYFHECSSFWSYHQDKLDQWTQEVKDSGHVGDFGANMIY